MSLPVWNKQPADSERVPITFVDYLASAGNDTIVTCGAAVTGTPPDSALVIGTVQDQDGIVYVRVSGGTDGKEYHVTATITTLGGNTKEYDFRVKVKEK